jgi:hypothetical protein
VDPVGLHPPLSEAPEFPNGLPNASNFGPSFFAIKYRWAYFMNVLCQYRWAYFMNVLCHLLLERADEAIVNAG